MAIERVDLYQNTSELPDVALSHRLGLIPIKIDPDQFDNFEPEGEETDRNSLLFRLQVKCPADHGGNLHVYSDSLQWQPLEGQRERLGPDGAPRPVADDILLLKLAPSQQVEAVLHVRKGLGKDHAKYSPVAVSSYRHPTELQFAPDRSPLSEEEVTCLRQFFPKGHLDMDQLDEQGMPRIINRRLPVSDLSFVQCRSLKKKLLVHTNRDVLTCRSPQPTWSHHSNRSPICSQHRVDRRSPGHRFVPQIPRCSQVQVSSHGQND